MPGKGPRDIMALGYAVDSSTTALCPMAEKPGAPGVLARLPRELETDNPRPVMLTAAEKNRSTSTMPRAPANIGGQFGHMARSSGSQTRPDSRKMTLGFLIQPSDRLKKRSRTKRTFSESRTFRLPRSRIWIPRDRIGSGRAAHSESNRGRVCSQAWRKISARSRSGTNGCVSDRMSTTGISGRCPSCGIVSPVIPGSAVS